MRKRYIITVFGWVYKTPPRYREILLVNVQFGHMRLYGTKKGKGLASLDGDTRFRVVLALSHLDLLYTVGLSVCHRLPIVFFVMRLLFIIKLSAQHINEKLSDACIFTIASYLLYKGQINL